MLIPSWSVQKIFTCRLTDPEGVVKFQRSNQKNGIKEIDPVSNQGNHFIKLPQFLRINRRTISAQIICMKILIIC
jgi:hypothetical protein